MPFFQLDYISVFSVRVYTLLISCGDIYPNTGPSSSNPSISLNNSLSRSSGSSSLTEILTFDHHLSFIHYNIQSISSKLDILHSEILDFDILAFTETWLSPATPTDDLLIDSFNKPERKDRHNDVHGGVMIYIKDGLHYKCRPDLEPNTIDAS